MAALNPTDQIFDFEELEYYYQVANRKEDPTNNDEEGEEIENENPDEKKPKEEKSDDLKNSISENQENSTMINQESPQIDNPYLKSVSMLKKKFKSE